MPEYCFFVNRFKIEKTIFPYKTALSNRMESTKWNYHKERNFVTNKFDFFESFISELEPLINNSFNVSTTQMSIFIFFLSA